MCAAAVTVVSIDNGLGLRTPDCAEEIAGDGPILPSRGNQEAAEIQTQVTNIALHISQQLQT